MDVVEAAVRQVQPRDEEMRARARERLEDLIMPHWALGRVMDLALELAGMTGSMAPPVSRRTIVTMAADHGVAAQGVSQYPQEVTGQMVANFAAGGAGINALARVAGARLVVVDMGVKALPDLSAAPIPVRSCPVGRGSDDITAGPAMAPEAALQAVATGVELARELAPETDVFGTGDMGIANTTPSAAIAACLTGEPAAAVTGTGTGIDAARLQHKIAAVERALAINAPDPRDGMQVLARLGGFEIGGLAGLILGAAGQRRPVVIDGFISTAAALIAAVLCPAARDYMILAHSSAEAGHGAMCAFLGQRPLLDLGFRLGEGTGAALAMPLLEAAARVLTEVRTFGEAGVAGQSPG